MGLCRGRQPGRDQPTPARGSPRGAAVPTNQTRQESSEAVVAVARHLAEAAWWVLTKQEVYREPQNSRLALSSTHG